MRHMKAMLLGAALMAGTTTLAMAQNVVPVQWGWGQRDNDDRQAFRDGLNQGQQDARHNRRFNPESSRWRERDDRQAYRSGYERGFQQYGGYRNGDYGRDRDGDGDRDDRPTQDSNYKHADRGYSSSYGNKDYYKQAYRQAYENGYQQGYNSGGGWRRY